MSACTKVAGCRREAGHRGAHVGHDGKRIPKGASGPAGGDPAEARADGLVSVRLSRAQLKLLLEAADQEIKDAIEAYKMDGSKPTFDVRQAVARYLKIETLCESHAGRRDPV